MPYKKNYKRKARKGRKLWPYYRMARSALGSRPAQYIMSAIARKIVKQYVNTEHKFIEDVQGTPQNVAYDNIQRMPLTPFLSQGTSTQSRIGNSVKWTLLSHKSTLTYNPTGPNTQTVRVMVVKTKFANSNATPINVILSASTPALYINAFRDLSNVRNYQVFYDKKYTLTDDNPTANINFNRKLQMKTRYQVGSNNGNITDVEFGQVDIYYISDVANASDPPTVKHATRARFIDN